MDSNEIVALSAAVAALAFVVLCGFLISFLRAARTSMLAARSAVMEAKETVESLQDDVKQLAETVNFVASDVKGKLQAAEPLFGVVHDVGEMLGEVTVTAKEAARGIRHAVRRQAALAEKTGRGDMPDWLRWVAIGTRFANGLKRGWQHPDNLANRASTEA